MVTPYPNTLEIQDHAVKHGVVTTMKSATKDHEGEFFWSAWDRDANLIGHGYAPNRAYARTDGTIALCRAVK